MLVLIGPVTVGKSTFTERCREVFDLEVISNDAIRRELFVEPLFTPEESAEVYAVAREQIKKAVISGQDVLYDGTNLRCSLRTSILSSLHGTADILFIVITPQEAVMAQQLRERELQNPSKRTWWSVYQEMIGEFEPPSGPHLVIAPAQGEAACKLLMRLGLKLKGA